MEQILWLIIPLVLLYFIPKSFPAIIRKNKWYIGIGLIVIYFLYIFFADFKGPWSHSPTCGKAPEEDQ